MGFIGLSFAKAAGYKLDVWGAGVSFLNSQTVPVQFSTRTNQDSYNSAFIQLSTRTIQHMYDLTRHLEQDLIAGTRY